MPTGFRSIETLLIDLPTIRPHILSMTTMYRQTVTLVRILFHDGIEGVGEATTIGGLSYGEESPEGIKLAIDTYISPLLDQCDLEQIGATMATIDRSVMGNRLAKCAIETALFDALGKRRGLSLSEMLGGGRLRDSMPVAWTLASGDTARDIEEAEQRLAERRHDVFKLKIGKRDIADDVAHVGAIKKALGDRASVRVDVNQAWSETSATKGMAMLAAAGIDLVEQPVARHALPAMTRLSARGDIPLMADEALSGPDSAFAIAAQAAANIFAVKISQSGGLLPAARVGAIADAAGIGLYGGTMLEGGVGTIASAHLFATFPKLEWGTELFGPLLLVEDILAEPVVYRDFSIVVPTGPGLGIALDDDKIAYFRRDRTSTKIAART